MKTKTIIAFIIGTFLLASASALTLTAGQNYTWDFSNQAQTINNISIQIINNTYNLDGLNFSINLPNVTLQISQYYKPDNFSIIFNINGKNTIYEPVGNGGSGGSGGGSSYCTTNWTCSSWSSCDSGTQMRNCSYPENFCKPIIEKPSIVESCEIINNQTIPTQNETKTTNNTTSIKKQNYPEPLRPWQYIGISIILIALIYFIRYKKKRNIKQKDLNKA